MNRVTERYLLKFDEIHKLLPRVLENPAKAKDAFYDMLIDAYIEGFSGVEYLLGVDAEVDAEKLAANIEHQYDGETIGEKFSKYLAEGDFSAIEDLWDSEFHRSYNTGAYDLANEYDVMKEWVTVGDKKVRNTHRYIHGLRIAVGDVFETYDGDYARFPGDFQFPENNANCRCILKYSSD